MRKLLSIWALAVLLFGIQHTYAAVIITDDGTGKTRNDRLLLGYDFVVGASNQTVTALGIWDDSASDTDGGAPASIAAPDGLGEAHDVGLWRTSDGALLGSVTVPSGVAGTLIGEFRYVALSSPVTLLAGTKYTLGAEYYGEGVNPDLWHDGQTEGNAGPAVYWTSGDFNSFEAKGGSSGTFVIPNGFSGGVGNAYIGPNAFYGGAIPEPASVGVLLVGSLLTLRRRRAR